MDQPEPANSVGKSGAEGGRRGTRIISRDRDRTLATILTEGARSARACGKVADAATWLEELVEIAATMPERFTPADLADMHHRLGTALYRLNRLEPAVKHLRIALKHDSARAKSWFFLGVVQETQHDPGAAASFERAYELDPASKGWRQQADSGERQLSAS